jgi:hypothetical protein
MADKKVIIAKRDKLSQVVKDKVKSKEKLTDTELEEAVRVLIVLHSDI